MSITYIPIGCPDLDLLVQGTNLKADKLRLLLHQMVLSRVNQINSKKNQMQHIFSDGYVSLASTILRSLLSSKYKRYVSFLINMDIIQTRSSSSSSKAYTPGKACIHYKINPLLLHAEGTHRHFRKETVFDFTCVKAVFKTTERFSANPTKIIRSIPLEPIHHYLFAMEQLIRFNTSEANYWLTKQESEGNININYNTIFEEMDKLHFINDGYFFKKVDQFGNRMHSPLKNVKSELRAFMYFEGFEKEPLISFDIRNSQLYFLTLLFNPKIVDEFIPEFSPIKDIVSKYIECDDVKVFIKHAVSGKIYNKWQAYRDLNTRDLAKMELINILFAKKNSRGIRFVEFKNLLPNVKAFLDEVKSLNESALPFIPVTYLNRKGEYKPNSYHCNLSCAVQRLESRIFTKRFGQKLLDANVERFVTVHDSIYFPTKYFDKIEKIFYDTFDELGVSRPNIKIQTPID